MRSALERVASKEPSDNDLLDAVGTARIINQAHGGAIIAAWEVSQLDQIWYDIFMGVANDLPVIRRRNAEVQKRFKEFEKRHSTYGKSQLRN